VCFRAAASVGDSDSLIVASIAWLLRYCGTLSRPGMSGLGLEYLAKSKLPGSRCLTRLIPPKPTQPDAVSAHAIGKLSPIDDSLATTCFPIDTPAAIELTCRYLFRCHFFAAASLQDLAVFFSPLNDVR
jgi:hypothetical protein